MANPMYGQNKNDAILANQTQVAISDELDLTSTAGVYSVLDVPAGTYVLGVQILVTSAITAGSMDIDIGDGDDADRFIVHCTKLGGVAPASLADTPVNL